MTVAPIREKLKPFLPADARLLDTYSYEFDGEPGLDLNNRSNSIVDIYHSDWLATRFTDNQWRKEGMPGRFYITYNPLVIRFGNGPLRNGHMRDKY